MVKVLGVRQVRAHGQKAAHTAERSAWLLRILELSYNNVGGTSDKVDKNFSMAFLELFHSAASEEF